MIRRRKLLNKNLLSDISWINGFLLCQLADSFHQFFFSFRIDIGDGLVQNDDGRILHHGVGDGKPLALAAGKRASCLADDGIIALGQLHDEVVGSGPSLPL